MLSDIQQRVERLAKSYVADACIIYFASLPADAGGRKEIYFMYVNYRHIPSLRFIYHCCDEIS